MRLFKFVASAFVAGVLMSSAPAMAAVSLSPTAAAPGQTVDLVFHVTNSQGSISTNQVLVTFPESPLITSVSASSPAGWSSTVDASTGNVATVTFDAGKLAPGQSADFYVSTPVPAGSSLAFKVKQSYDDGSSSIPDTVTMAIGGEATTTTEPPTTTSVTTSTLPPTTVDMSKVKEDSGGSIVGRVLVVIGLVAAIMVFLRSRRVQ